MLYCLKQRQQYDLNFTYFFCNDFFCWCSLIKFQKRAFTCYWYFFSSQMLVHMKLQSQLKMVLSCLMRSWVVFRGQQTRTIGHAGEVCAEERTWASSFTWNQSLAPHPQPKDQDIIRTWTSELFQKLRVHCQGNSLLKPLYHKWPSSKILSN